MLIKGIRLHKFGLVKLTICMRLFPPCEVMTRRSGLRLLTIWGLGGGGGDLAGTTFPRLLPLETVRRPGEALALVYPLAAGVIEVQMDRNQWKNQTGECKQQGADIVREIQIWIKNIL